MIDPEQPIQPPTTLGQKLAIGATIVILLGFFVLSAVLQAYELPPNRWLIELQLLWLQGSYYPKYTMMISAIWMMSALAAPLILFAMIRSLVQVMIGWNAQGRGPALRLKEIDRLKIAIISGTLGILFAGHLAICVIAPELYVISDGGLQSVFGLLPFILSIVAPIGVPTCLGFLLDLLTVRKVVVVRSTEPLVTEPMIHGLGAAIKEADPQRYAALLIGERLMVEVTAFGQLPVSLSRA